jgi:hypothetical protein
LSGSSRWLTRFLFLRLLGLVYAVAFLVVVLQWLRLPAPAPLFWLADSDAAFRIGGWLGLAASLVVLAGFANVPLLAGLWFLYMP